MYPNHVIELVQCNYVLRIENYWYIGETVHITTQLSALRKAHSTFITVKLMSIGSLRTPLGAG